MVCELMEHPVLKIADLKSTFSNLIQIHNKALAERSLLDAEAGIKIMKDLSDILPSVLRADGMRPARDELYKTRSSRKTDSQ